MKTNYVYISSNKIYYYKKQKLNLMNLRVLIWTKKFVKLEPKFNKSIEFGTIN